MREKSEQSFKLQILIKHLNSYLRGIVLELRGFEGAMHIATLPPKSLRNAMHGYKNQQQVGSALLDNTRRSLVMALMSRQPARVRSRSIRAFAGISADEDFDEDVADWEGDEDDLDVEEFDNVTITTDAQDDG